jgi:spermidine synthase
MAAPVSALTVPSSRSTLAIVIGMLGFTAIIGQIVLMRELIVAFSGNEISLGIMLATWLLWTAAGSALVGGFVGALTNTRRIVAILECLLGLTLPVTIWAVRASKVLFQTVPGELIGPLPMLLTCLGCLAIFCALSGCLYVAVARLYKEERFVSSIVASSSAYLLDGAGSALGGAIASLLLLRYLEPFQIATFIIICNVCMAGILLFEKSNKGKLAVFLLTGALASPLFLYVAPQLRGSSQKILWSRFHLLDSHDSIYGNLAVIETVNVRSIYDNGIILASAPDDAAAENGVHYALLEHPAPSSVLLIGGGTNGSVGQALKHPTLKRLDYVELDPAVIHFSRKFFPTETSPLSDARVRIHYADGRQFLRTTRDSFDVVIINLPDPQTAQLNRFYTAEFFRNVKKHLNSGGLLALQLRASEDYISPELAEFLRCIYRTLNKTFPYTAVIPGETVHFFASSSPNLLTEDPTVLTTRLRERNLQTRYVREYFIPFRMMPDRMMQIRSLLQATEATPVNRDFQPIAYYFDVVLWSAQFKASHYQWFRTAARIPFIRVAVGILLLALGLALPLAYLPKHENKARAAAVSCVAATGFTLMALQLCLLLAFQSIYGYVYNQLAILIGMFMGGVALGSWLALRLSVESKPARAARIATITQCALAISVPLLMSFVALLARSSRVTGTLFVPQLAFPIMAVLCGILGGFQFPVATEIYIRNQGEKSNLGTLYAVDLLGGCVGALLLSGYLIPVFGFWKTAWLSAPVNLAPVLLAGRVSLETRPRPAWDQPPSFLRRSQL